MPNQIAFVDTEIGMEDHQIHDIGAVRPDGSTYHGESVQGLCAFLAESDFLCGHNLVHHDATYLLPRLSPLIPKKNWHLIDTLYMSPLLFPSRPYHALLKDDKLQTDDLNNPLNDAMKAQKLFFDEVSAFQHLPTGVQQVYYHLLHPYAEFYGFFKYLGFSLLKDSTESLILSEYKGLLCENTKLTALIRRYPVELAYALALIASSDYHSITPPWLLKNYPRIEDVMKYLCNTPCEAGCPYCTGRLDVKRHLKLIFGYDSFRTYNGEPLQERAAQAAVDGKSLLAVFPTGGGKSITFQLPALMAGQSVHGLTVVISPLQSLMKDQVDNLNERGILDAVTVNGMLSPIERGDAFRRVENGSATLLYISPEQLRSRTIEKLLLSRNIVRFVIDEAHCFSAWGHDFRVDYLYIGDFIRELQRKKQSRYPVPVSCFTATAKQKVISDIRDYFKRKLDVDLELFASTATRENLHYTVLFRETEEEKYNTLRALVEQKKCPTIIYVSRTRRTRELAEKLTRDGFPALPYNGKMEANEKIANQEAFLNDEVKVIVATSAFGMGVDKKDVRLVIHYEISDSLENYVQEAGRAGRDPSLEAECYVLFNNGDLDKHFILLNQTKLSIGEIQQVWKAIKDMTAKGGDTIHCSPLEIARQAGWDDTNKEMETRVKTAISALEQAGYLKRGRNVPHVYATSICVKNMEEASRRIEASALFSENQRLHAKRIISSLISSRSIANAGNDDAESRVDYLADILGMEKQEVISVINLMRQESILSDAQDMTAHIYRTDTENKSLLTLRKFAKLERFLLERLPDEGCTIDYKTWNEAALAEGIKGSTVKNIRTILYFLTIRNHVKKAEGEKTQAVQIIPAMSVQALRSSSEKRLSICAFLVSELFQSAEQMGNAGSEERLVLFSLVGMWQAYNRSQDLRLDQRNATLSDVSDALLYLSKIGAMRLEGGFLVLYNGMEIKRLIRDNRIKYKVDDYRLLNEYYKQKIQQIHIVGEYANLMVRDYDAALQFVQDYFQMDFKQFLNLYFKGSRRKEIDRNVTPDKYHRLFDSLSEVQSQIIQDQESRYIVVAAGPGSGKTRVLVHKLASLLTMEDVKHEQMLMLTFSRAAATEFKTRLMELVGNAAHFVEIKTFHSYCFDLLGRNGNLEEMQDVVKNAAEMIRSGEVEPNRIMKRVLVIDEAQDMDQHEYALVRALMQVNEDMRVIAVGDDDQNIYQFRGSDSRYMRAFIRDFGAVQYEMEENYRSRKEIVALSNAFVATLRDRMKTKQIVSVQEESGTVEIIRHISEHMEEAVVDHIAANRDSGTVGVLTNTNFEALQITGLLNRRGIRAKLIQSHDSFDLRNLVEVRFFLDYIDASLREPVIGDALWERAKTGLRETYQASNCLSQCLNMIQTFETVNQTKYRSDLDLFLRESDYDDFCETEGETVLVSTIHKAKGREFDTVYLMLKNQKLEQDEEKRKLYVAMTRAKQSLYIHCNSDLFDRFQVLNVIRKTDGRSYGESDELLMQLNYRDVFLDYYKSRQAILSQMRSGAKLQASNAFLSIEQGGKTCNVAKLSQACRNQIENHRAKGYYPVEATASFLVHWKGKEDEQETIIILPLLKLEKKGTSKAEKQPTNNTEADSIILPQHQTEHGGPQPCSPPASTNNSSTDVWKPTSPPQTSSKTSSPSTAQKPQKSWQAMLLKWLNRG